MYIQIMCWSQRPLGLRRRSAAARLLRLWVRIPTGTWIFVCCECCVLSGRGLCDEPITRPEESYRLWCVVVCDLETSSRTRRPWPALDCRAIGEKNTNYVYTITRSINSWYFGALLKVRKAIIRFVTSVGSFLSLSLSLSLSVWTEQFRSH